MTISQDDYLKLASRFPPEHIGVAGAATYSLFHAPNSICSQKVRATLIGEGVAFNSHTVNIIAGENYDPTYVRMRANECEARGLPFAAFHDGGSSVMDFGCDACVVPTLVTTDGGEVMVDSMSICKVISTRASRLLYPAEWESEIDAELSIVDRLQNYGLLAPKLSTATKREDGKGFYNAKIEHCARVIADYPDDTLLVAALEAKQRKEESAISRLLTEEEIALAHQKMEAAFTALSGRLTDDATLLFSDALTLADIFWAIELIRAEDVGQGEWIWVNPRLNAYYEALMENPTIVQAILAWPDARIKF